MTNSEEMFDEEIFNIVINTSYGGFRIPSDLTKCIFGHEQSSFDCSLKFRTDARLVEMISVFEKDPSNFIGYIEKTYGKKIELSFTGIECLRRLAVYTFPKLYLDIDAVSIENYDGLEQVILDESKKDLYLLKSRIQDLVKKTRSDLLSKEILLEELEELLIE